MDGYIKNSARLEDSERHSYSWTTLRDEPMREDGTMSEETSGNTSDASPAKAPARSAPAPAAAAVSDTIEVSGRAPLKGLGDEALRLLLHIDPLEDELPSKPTATYATTRRRLNFRGFLIDGKHGFGSVEESCVHLVDGSLGQETGKPGKKRGRSPGPGPVRANKKLARGEAQTPGEADCPNRSLLNVVLEDAPDRPAPSLEVCEISPATGIKSPKAASVEPGPGLADPDQADHDQAEPNEATNEADPEEEEEVTPVTTTRKKKAPNRGVHPTKCHLSDRCILFFKNHLKLCLKDLPPYASDDIPRHELARNCTVPAVDLRLVDFPVSAEELLTYFPLSTRWYSVLVRLYAHGWKGAAIHHYIYWSRGLTQPTTIEVSTLSKQHSKAQEWCDENLTESPIKANPSGFSPKIVRKYDTGLHDYYLVDLAEGVVNHPTRGALALTHAVQHAVRKGNNGVLLSGVRKYVEREKLFDIDTLEDTYDARTDDMAAKVFHEKVTKGYCKMIRDDGKNKGGQKAAAGGGKDRE